MRRLFCTLLLAACVSPGCAPRQSRPVLFEDNFNDPTLPNWYAELEKGGSVTARDGRLDIDVPGGCTVWFKPVIEGPVVIKYEVTAIRGGGPNDRVSDLNCFWMARDARSPDDLFATKRSGAFADYNQLRCYYVGLGGNENTTTRFRRYVGDPVTRPLLPEHDLGDARDLILANVPQVIRLVADGRRIEFHRDGRLVFEMIDPDPYTSGWFGLRTVANHMSVRRFRVYSLTANK